MAVLGAKLLPTSQPVESAHARARSRLQVARSCAPTPKTGRKNKTATRSRSTALISSPQTQKSYGSDTAGPAAESSMESSDGSENRDNAASPALTHNES